MAAILEVSWIRQGERPCQGVQALTVREWKDKRINHIWRRITAAHLCSPYKSRGEGSKFLSSSEAKTIGEMSKKGKTVEQLKRIEDRCSVSLVGTYY